MVNFFFPQGAGDFRFGKILLLSVEELCLFLRRNILIVSVFYLEILILTWWDFIKSGATCHLKFYVKPVDSLAEKFG